MLVEQLLVVAALGAELGRIGALEAVDRLLLVADDEDGARRASRAPAPAKNSAEIASITRHCAGLVSCASSTRMWSRPPSSRQSTQAAIAGQLQQVAGPVDQVVEVEQAARAPCGRRRPPASAARSGRAPRRGEGGVGEAQRPRRLDPPHQRVERRHQPGVARRGPPGSGSGRPWRRTAPSRLAAEEQHAPRAARARVPGRGRRARRRGARRLRVARAAPGQERDEGAEQRPRVGVSTSAASAAGVISGRAPSAAARPPASNGAAKAARCVAISRSSGSGSSAGSWRASAAKSSGVRARRGRRAPPRAAPAPGGPRARRTAARRRPRAGSGAAAPRRRRGWSGSSGRPGVSSARAKSVRARASCAGGIASPGSPSVAQRRAQRGVVEHRPAAERLEQPVLHLGRRRLGVGEAEDLLRLGAGQQQPRHPVGQHPGLARAGIGRDPARRAGVAARTCAATASLTRPPPGASPSAHSPLRDRWS